MNILKNIKMKRIFFIAFILISLTSINAQKVCSMNSRYDADIKVFVVNSKYSADLLVYKVSSQYSSGNNEGRWFFTNSHYNADVKIYFVNSKYDADLKIFFVKSRYNAGWRNKAKKHLMY